MDGHPVADSAGTLRMQIEVSLLLFSQLQGERYIKYLAVTLSGNAEI